METSEQNHFKSLKDSKKFPRMFNDTANMIAVYTVFCILRRMRRELGLEAMLEYMDEYVQTIERHNPLLKKSVINALSRISIEKMYKDAVR